MKLLLSLGLLGIATISYCPESPSVSGEYKEISLKDEDNQITLPPQKSLSSSEKIIAQQEPPKNQKIRCQKCLFCACSPFLYCTYLCNKQRK